MKNYKKILEEIKANKNTIEAQEAEIIVLTMEEEKTSAIKNGTMKEYKAIAEEAKKNAGKVSALCESIYRLKIINKILQSNAEAAFIAESIPVIKAAFKKYEGKKYGEKTRENIRQEAKNNGVFFYIGGTTTSETLHLCDVTPEGYTGRMKIELYTKVHFISPENRIQAEAAEVSERAYIENPEERAEEIIQAKRQLEEATKAARAAESALNNLLPRSIDHVYNTKNDYITLNV